MADWVGSVSVGSLAAVSSLTSSQQASESHTAAGSLGDAEGDELASESFTDGRVRGELRNLSLWKRSSGHKSWVAVRTLMRRQPGNSPCVRL